MGKDSATGKGDLMLKPGKIPMILACAALLALLASCAAGPDPDPAEPDPAPSEIITDADEFPETLPGQEQDDSPEPSEEPVEEPAGEPNPIPLLVPGLDTDAPDTAQMPESLRIFIPIPYIETENAVPAVSQKKSDPDKFEDAAQYFGRWIIQSRGIDVACYLSASQDVVDAEDAAAFFQLGDQYVIGDHSNQDFRSLGSCQPGDLACLETENGIAIYVCTAIIQGHNLEETITDDDGNSIEYGFNTGGITCYTCNDNWQNIHVVLFAPIA